jgi:hypothetical protein
MKKVALAIVLTAVGTAPAFAQNTAVGTGLANSSSTSAAGAVAIGGGNATGGNATAAGGKGGKGVGIGVGNGTVTANPRVTVNNNSNTPADQTVRNVPTAFAPGLAAAGLETCLGSVSGGGSFVGTGFSFGSTIPDPGCAARLDARTLWSMGLKKAAVARLCLTGEIARSMPEICSQYTPGYAVATGAAPLSYVGGEIWLTEGATGKNRLCSNYDAGRQRCRVWAGTVVHHAPKKLAQAPAAPKVAPAPAEAKTTAPAPAVAESPKKEDKHD